MRELAPFHANLRKRLVKTAKVYVRDSGLLHCLLGLRTRDDLLAHPVCGASWEGFVIEQILALAPRGSSASFYRSAAGAEIDLLLEAMRDLGLKKAYMVCPVQERFSLGHGVEALPVEHLTRPIAARAWKSWG